MLQVQFLDTDEYQFSKKQKTKATNVLQAAYGEVKQLLPDLSTYLNVTIYPGKNVIPEKGGVGRAINKNWIQIEIDPSHKRSINDIIDVELRRTFFHEAHHTVRFIHNKWRDNLVADAIFEGLGTVFERDYVGGSSPWGEYDQRVIDDWAQELLSLDESKINRADWFFDHPDGRRWVAYRVGTYLIDRVMKLHPERTSANMVNLPALEILELSEIKTHSA